MVASMVVWPAFVVVPQDGEDWATNWETTLSVLNALAAVVVVLGAVTAACLVLAKIRLRKARPATRTLAARESVTVGSAFIAMVRYVAGPLRRARIRTMQEAVAPLIDTLRDENTEQHADTSRRLTAVEDRQTGVEGAVVELAARVSALEQVVNPAGIVQDLVEKMTELSETVRTDRHNARNAMSVLSGSVELLTDEIRQMRTGS